MHPSRSFLARNGAGCITGSMPGQRAPGQTVIALALDQRLLALVDDARSRVGQDRSTFIRLALVEYLEKAGVPTDRALAFSPDRARPKKQTPLLQRVADILPNDSVINEEPVRVSPLTEIGPPKGQLDITEEARMASLEAQLPPGLLDAVMDDALMEVANRGLRSAGSGGASPTEPPGPPPEPASRRARGSKRERKGAGSGKK